MEFLKSNAAKVAIVVVLGGAALFLTVRNTGGGGPARGLPNAITCVCVETGEIFHISRDDMKFIPIENPKTGRATLLPAVERDDGLYVAERNASALHSDELKPLNKYVDEKTLKVKKD